MIPNTKDSDKESAFDIQVGGSHYKHFVIQPTEFSYKNKLNNIQSNVVKYICRYNLKGTPLKDLNKAKHFIDLLVELEGLDEYSCSDAGHPQTKDDYGDDNSFDTYFSHKL